MSERISFACLKHDGHSCNCMGFGLMCVASYAKKVFGSRIEVELSQIAKDLETKLTNNTPRVLCFSNYCWNFNISCEFAKRVKGKSPETVIVFGGPNYPILESDQKKFLEIHPEIDFYIFRDGELPFAEFLKVLFEYDFDVKKIKESRISIPQAHYLSENEIVCGEMGPLIMDLDEIPSPYLSGLSDALLVQNLIPVIQTKRGCPFQCTFCEDGHSYHNKIRRFSFERIKAELWYIATRTKAPHVLIADLNFGMYEEDIDVAHELAMLQKKLGWPKYFGQINGKNNKERVLKVTSIIKDASYHPAVQSTDTAVLKNIKRSNISEKKMIEAAKEVKNLGISSVSELILCLPGDSLQAHLKSNFDLMDAGIETIRSHQAVMLPGTEMASSSGREKFGSVTRFRVVPQTASSYSLFGKEFWAPEIDEICVANDGMSIEDYLEARCFNLTVEVFYNANVFGELIKFLNFYEISSSSFIYRIHQNLRENATPMRHVYEGFLGDSREIWETKQDVENFLEQPGIRKSYQDGELGNNEQLKYRAMSLLEHMSSMHAIAFGVAKKMIADDESFSEQVEEYLNELAEFSLSRKISLLSLNLVEKKCFHYDFISFMAKNFTGDPTLYYRPEKQNIMIGHSDSQRDLIENYLEIFGDSYYGFANMLNFQGVSKFFREARLLPQ